MRLVQLISGFLIIASIGCNQKATHVKKHDHTNHLINESSPYLLQHAHNPVDWYPWGEEALTRAKNENKIIIISVGYAACHWCHVMERESFEDTTVARIMNEHFINIKVDREERPDVDDVYMTACQMVSSKGCGWPLNAFALPDGRPFHAVTYVPKKGWMDMLSEIQKLREKEPARIDQIAQQLTDGIKVQDQIIENTDEQRFTQTELDEMMSVFYGQVDPKFGGRQGAPKFPMPGNYQLLLKYCFMTEDESSKRILKTTLDRMANGGIFDHLGGGFARYATDERWKIPHFEKMLYDNSQLVSLYSRAFQYFGDPVYKDRVVETLSFIERELMDQTGGVYSSLDADSEGEEGKFYVWASHEIDSLITDSDDRAIFYAFFDIKKGGNWEHDKNILHNETSLEVLTRKLDTSSEEILQSLKRSKTILFDYRSNRIRPGLDDKILTSWNALMITGYTHAYSAIGVQDYKAKSIRMGNFIVENMMDDDHRLWRNYKDGKRAINGFLDDYAFTISAFADLYQITFDEKWLNHAKALLDYSIEHFSGSQGNLFNFTSSIDPPLIAKKMENTDNVIPGSNSQMARNLHRLGLYFYNTAYIERSKLMLHNIKQNMSKYGVSFHSNWGQLYADFVLPPYEVAVVGPDADALSLAIQSRYLPNAIFLGGTSEGTLELLTDKLQEGETYVYVCQNKVCKLPVTDTDKALELIMDPIK